MRDKAYALSTLVNAVRLVLATEPFTIAWKHFPIRHDLRDCALSGTLP